MTERFREPEWAVSYLSSGLNNDFPNTTAQIILVSEAHSRRVACPVTEIEQVLREFCHEFPRLSVDYFPRNRDGVVAEIRCHGAARDDGQSRKDKHHHDHQHKHHPIIVIVVQKTESGEVRSVKCEV